MTFQTLYDLYAADLKAHAKESTCRSRLSMIRNHIPSVLEGPEAVRDHPGRRPELAGRTKGIRLRRIQPVYGELPLVRYVQLCHALLQFEFQPLPVG